jgi:hypothetical protein
LQYSDFQVGRLINNDDFVFMSFELDSKTEARLDFPSRAARLSGDDEVHSSTDIEQSNFQQNDNNGVDNGGRQT